ncbi:MAG: rRNA maturation RNase YbeY [Butyribacter sp.]|nr:rRNA maturation RNase YbeY [bacterium]MDY3853443.1 rRNA maturation RNase YbeY [Butyribacter sp.]
MGILFEKEIEDELEFDYEALLEKVVEEALRTEECPYPCEVNITLTDNEGIRELNQEYRELDVPTDVLSFPMVEYEIPGDFSHLDSVAAKNMYFNLETSELLLGDIVISVERAREQAEEYGHSLSREIAFLTAHSMLHLMGYDHMEDDEREVMEKKQEQILQNLGITRNE